MLLFYSIHRMFISWFINLEYKKHLISLCLTISNVVIAIIFNIVLSSCIGDINMSGKIRYLQEKVKMCYISSLFENIDDIKLPIDIEPHIFELCFVNYKDELLDTTKTVYNKYRSNIFLTNKNTIQTLYDNVEKYVSQTHNIGFSTNNSMESFNALMEISDIILENANLFTKELVDIARTIMFILAGAMCFVILSQVFYNINTIVFKQKRKKKYEITVENKAINQMCHELRSSLLPIELCLRELEEYVIPTCHHNDTIPHVTNNISKCIQEIDYTLKRRLDFANILNNTYKITINDVDIVEFIKSYIPIYEMYAISNNKKCKINMIYDIELEDYFCHLDTYLLHHILTNLLRNAVKFGRDDIENNMTIRIRVQNKRLLIISIEDTGIGFTNKNKNKQKDSYGLGLPFVKNILNMFKKGTFGYYNKSNDNGTVVYFYFELDSNICLKNLINVTTESDNVLYDNLCYTSHDESHESYTSRESRESCDVYDEIIDIDNITVYVIDDSYVVLQCVERVIKKISKNKWKIKLFLNCEEFLEYHKEIKYKITDVFIVDNNMESSGGILKGVEFVKLLRNEKNLLNIIIIMSGNYVECKLADIIWGKPLPKNDVIYNTISFKLNEIINKYNENIL
jgi:signal transduction histidine kinase